MVCCVDLRASGGGSRVGIVVEMLKKMDGDTKLKGTDLDVA